MKKVLVTGASGFIGNQVIRKLLNKGIQVVASSLNKEKAEKFDWFNKVIYKPFNLHSDYSNISLMDYFGRPDSLIHLAWEGLPNYTSMFHIEENLPTNYSFLKQLTSEGLTDITVTGTCFEYGMVEGKLCEDYPSCPDNPYALAKDSLRKYLQQLQKIVPFQLKWIRLFYMYGEGQSSKSLYTLLMEAIAKNAATFNMSGGEQIRDFLPVEDVAENIIAIALQNKELGIINCGSGKPTSVLKLVEMLLKQHHSNLSLNLGYYPYPNYEPMYFWADIRKLNKILNTGNE